MPYKDKEDQKRWREVNKEKIKQDKKKRYAENKEQLKVDRIEYYEANKEKQLKRAKEYSRTPAGKKSHTQASWRFYGVKDVNDEMYECYINTTKCDCCAKIFSSSKDRHLDHDHETGEFRQILCSKCNTYDNWKKIKKCSVEETEAKSTY